MTVNEKKMPAKDNITSKDHNIPKLPSYETPKELMEYTNFRKYVEDHRAPPFYDDLGNIQVKY